MTAVLQAGDSLAADDRAFLYGDGLFETLVAREGVLLWPELHESRLREGLRRLGINLDLAAALDALGSAPEAGRYLVIRLTASRGGGPRGYAPALDGAGRWYLSARSLDRDPLTPLPPAQVIRSTVVLGSQPQLAGLKHCNRLEQVLAAQQAAQAGADDALLAGPGGGWHSCSSGNLFVLCGGELLTAPCENAGIAGTRRQLLIEKLAPQLGLRVVFRAPHDTALVDADGAFFCNSVIGIRALASIDGRAVRAAPQIAELQSAYRQLGETCVGSC